MSLLLLPAVCGAESIQEIRLGDGWRTETQGPWRVRTDHRNLIAMRHGWEAGTEGHFAMCTRPVSVPAAWKGEISLAFYCSDDYHTDTWRPDGSWLTAEGFLGHRFKRVLVNGQPVWNQDVSDAVTPGASPRFRIPIAVQPGQTFQLSVLAYDAVSTPVQLGHDFYQSANNEKRREEDPNAVRFQTHVYWGDFHLLEGGAEAPEGRRPSEILVRDLHQKRWPLPPFGDGWTAPSAALRVDTPPVPKGGFPLHFGLPLPTGKIRAPEELRLQTEDGRALPAQKAVRGRWPDGSLRWLAFDAILPKGQETLTVAFKKDRPLDAGRLPVETEDRIDLAVNPAAIGVRRGERPVIIGGGALGITVRIRGDDALGTAGFLRTVERGPVCTTLAAEGALSALDRTLGSFTLYVTVWPGHPLVRIWARYFNDTPETLPVSSLRLFWELPKGAGPFRTQGADNAPAMDIVQKSASERLANGARVDSLAPTYVAWDGGAVVVRHFRERFPKRLTADAERVTIDLAAGDDSPTEITPGEALSHEVWFSTGGIDAGVLAALVERPPVLSNPEYYCASGVLGPARPAAGVPKIGEKLRAIYGGKTWDELGQLYGLRDFPDGPYIGGLPNWANNYYERMLNLWSAWFITGDREWHDRAVETCRHLLDTAIIHSDVPGHDWRGAMHGPGANHTAGPWNPTLRIAGLDLYQKLSGDPEARDAFLGVADFVLRTRAGLDSQSVRDHAGPFDTVVTAYTETGEADFLDEGAARVERAWKMIDRRRGVWPETHGSMVYRGNVPWMVAQLGRPLYFWYRITGDVEAAQAVVALAESIVCENTDWVQPGAVFGYSHNPHFPMSDAYDPLILPLIFAAYELTGDPFLLDAALAQWKRWASSETFDSIFNTFWNTPWLLWHLHRALPGTQAEPAAP